jgi:hypothetical protein
MLDIRTTDIRTQNSFEMEGYTSIQYGSVVLCIIKVLTTLRIALLDKVNIKKLIFSPKG